MVPADIKLITDHNKKIEKAKKILSKSQRRMKINKNMAH